MPRSSGEDLGCRTVLPPTGTSSPRNAGHSRTRNRVPTGPASCAAPHPPGWCPVGTTGQEPPGGSGPAAHRRLDVAVDTTVAGSLRALAAQGLPPKSLLAAAHAAVLRLVTRGRRGADRCRGQRPAGGGGRRPDDRRVPQHPPAAARPVVRHVPGHGPPGASPTRAPVAAHRRYPTHDPARPGRGPPLDSYVNFMDFHRDRHRSADASYRHGGCRRDQLPARGQLPGRPRAGRAATVAGLRPRVLPGSSVPGWRLLRAGPGSPRRGSGHGAHRRRAGPRRSTRSGCGMERHHAAPSTPRDTCTS